MYIPHYYQNENIEEVKAFIQANSFGILIDQVEGKPWGTHIPLELETDNDGEAILVSHLAKANPQAKALVDGKEVLCIFNGPHHYISSSWYKEEEVPTWNYIAVHVYGNLKVLSEEETMASMHRLVEKYEQMAKNPIDLSKFSSKTLRQVKGTVGFKVKITDIQAAYKMSQTRSEDHATIMSELKELDTAASKAVADKMKK
ncbi:FMN-binding negative transcriptional regulator [Flavobacterium sp. ASW18X]|uniref:FMN-binding negative transcriptional regulator n=1 Tax=Flavobacterium sp. ASW18X TaxID=2572595 RepID=UPI0010ADCADD|nr:FMN-binding negative transcriptional regulator [Flavobacterium sp. ASW18X]TKD62562.1 FMN-binding negative transcriptional regulator [Flavobacterium sp. ASW18X]